MEIKAGVPHFLGLQFSCDINHKYLPQLDAYRWDASLEKVSWAKLPHVSTANGIHTRPAQLLVFGSIGLDLATSAAITKGCCTSLVT